MEFSEIWKTLSAINVNAYVQEKMGLRFLSWARAWEAVMSVYPDARFKMLPSETFGDGSVEVWCSVEIKGHERSMWLPVMDHRNNSIVNPSSRQVSDARMRCLVKCLAMFGLGLYIYQGEDIPRAEKQAAIESSKPELLPTMTKVWENAKKAYLRDGNLDKVKARFTISQDNEMSLVQECSQ
jgi:hypothetical protein